MLGILTRHRLSAGRRLALTLWAKGVGVLLMMSLPGIGSLIVGALLTCGYALGQLAGPMLSALST